MSGDMKNENNYLGKLLECIVGFKWKAVQILLWQGNLRNKGWGKGVFRPFLYRSKESLGFLLILLKK